MVLQQRLQKTQHFLDKGVQSSVEFKFIIYLKDSKLDVDLGYVANEL
jgi:hypothetical protein